jgi:hypothetical protein
VSTHWGAGFHAPPVGGVDACAYDRYIGRWSRLFVPALLAAADVRIGSRVLDVATGSGEASLEATSVIGESGMMVGVDISSAMLNAAVGDWLESHSFLLSRTVSLCRSVTPALTLCSAISASCSFQILRWDSWKPGAF